MVMKIANGKNSVGKSSQATNLAFSSSCEPVISKLDPEIIAVLKVLDDTKYSRYVRKALENKDFLTVIIEYSSMEDWALRWGISRILVQVCIRKPELMKDSIPLLVSRLAVEDKRMIRDNIMQSLVHLSKSIPDDFVGKGAVEPFLKYLRKGEDHERFDAITVMKNIARTDPEVVKGQIVNIEKIATEIDNPVVTGEAERTLAFLRDSIL